MEWIIGLLILVGTFLYMQSSSNQNTSTLPITVVDVPLPADALNQLGLDANQATKEDITKLLDILAGMARLQERAKHLRSREDAQALQKELAVLQKEFEAIKRKYPNRP